MSDLVSREDVMKTVESVCEQYNMCFDMSDKRPGSFSADMPRAIMEIPAADSERLKEGDIVQHFKRELLKDKENSMEYLYIIEAIATHTETGERLVVYRALYRNDERGVYFNVFARPYDMFMAEVKHEKYPHIKQKYRFEKFVFEN